MITIKEREFVQRAEMDEFGKGMMGTGTEWKWKYYSSGGTR